PLNPTTSSRHIRPARKCTLPCTLKQSCSVWTAWEHTFAISTWTHCNSQRSSSVRLSSLREHTQVWSAFGLRAEGSEYELRLRQLRPLGEILTLSLSPLVPYAE